MELRQLKHFVAVAETLNINKASERLYISQPGLSKSIANLEASLGVPLFERSGSRLHLLPAGEYLLKEAREVLAMTDHIESEITRFKAVDPGITIALEDNAALQWEEYYTYALNSLKLFFPERAIYTQPAADVLRQGAPDLTQCDFALIVHHNIEALHIPHYRKILDDEVGMLCSRGHLPEGTDPVSFRRFLENTSLLHLNYDFAIGEHFLDICRDLDYVPGVPRVVSPSIARVLIASQGSAAIIPRPFAFSYFRDDLVYVRFPSDIARLSIYAVWDDHVRDTSVIDVFCDSFRTAIGARPPFAEDDSGRCMYDLQKKCWIDPAK